MTTKEVLENFTREEGIALFNAKKTDKEIYDILVAKGLTDSFETFTSEAQKLFDEKVSKMSTGEILKQIDGAELTDDQLEQIAGGKGNTYENGRVVGAAIAGGCALGGIGIGLAAAAI